MMSMPVIEDPPSVRGFVAMLEAFRATGGTAPAEVLCRMLEELHGCSADELAELLRAGQVFGFEWRGSLWIPMFQFELESLEVKRGPQQVRAELPIQWVGWTLAGWFACAHTLLDEQRPVDMLDTSPSAVMYAAQLEPIQAHSVLVRMPSVRQPAQAIARA
jgi:hypothetical protein